MATMAATEGADADVPSNTWIVSLGVGGNDGAFSGLHVASSYEHTSQRVAIMETSGSARPPKVPMPATLACQLGCAYPPVQLPELSLVVQLLTPPPPPEMSMKGLATVLGAVPSVAVLQKTIGSPEP